MSVTRDYEIAGAVYPDPRKLYEKDEWYYESPYRPYRSAVCGFFFGIAAKMGHNWHQSRPMKAGNAFQLKLIVFAVEPLP